MAEIPTEFPTATVDATTRILGSPRVESWEWRILDAATGKMTGTLDGVESARITFDADAGIQSGGSLDYRGAPVDWHRILVQPVYTCETAEGTLSWPVGVYLPAVPVRNIDGVSIGQRVELYDKTVILSQSKTEVTTWLKDGQSVIERVTEVFEALDLTDVTITDSAVTATDPVSWPAGTTWLAMLSDLLGLLNYDPVHVDASGRFVVRPYTAPAERGVTHVFADDQYGIYTPDLTDSQDTFNTPNRLVMTSTPRYNGDTFTAIVENTDPADPLSIPYRGRTITETETDIMALSQPLINAAAARRMTELSAPARTLQIHHAAAPIRLGDVVQFTHSMLGLSAKAEVRAMSIDATVGGLTDTTLAVIP